MPVLVYLYRILFRSGKAYIGVTKHPDKRLPEHAAADTLIGRAIRKHGACSFRFQILAVCPSYEYAYALERRAISRFNTLPPFGYNISEGGPNGIGHSEETRRKIGESKRGNAYTLGLVHTEESKVKMSLASKGRGAGKTLSEETRKKIAVAHTGQRRSEEARRRMSAAAKGRVRSPETRKRMSEAKIRMYAERKAMQCLNVSP